MRTIGRPAKKNICFLSSHRATRELYANVPSHKAPVGALCEGNMIYAKGALCGSTALVTVIAGDFNCAFDYILDRPLSGKSKD